MSNEYTCPLCEEYLVKNKKGVMTNKNTGKEIKIYGCDECDQSFGLNDDKFGLMPYDFEMKKIEETCSVCTKVENFRQKVVFILGEHARYNTYCIDCGVEFLRNWVREERPENVNKVTHDNVEEISHVHEMVNMQKHFDKINKFKKNATPEQLKELRKRAMNEFEQSTGTRFDVEEKE